MKIGEKIKQRRMELGWSMRDLSTRMGYSNHSTIARIESGSVDIPQSRIIQFADILGVSVGYLMDWEEVQKKNDVLTDIILRMRNDNDFFEAVKRLNEFDSEKLSSLLTLLK